jgi:hypothetical protein
MVCDPDAHARMMIIMQPISGPPELVLVVLELRKQGPLLQRRNRDMSSDTEPRIED